MGIDCSLYRRRCVGTNCTKVRSRPGFREMTKLKYLGILIWAAFLWLSSACGTPCWCPFFACSGVASVSSADMAHCLAAKGAHLGRQWCEVQCRPADQSLSLSLSHFHAHCKREGGHNRQWTRHSEGTNFWSFSLARFTSPRQMREREREPCPGSDSERSSLVNCNCRMARLLVPLPERKEVAWVTRNRAHPMVIFAFHTIARLCLLAVKLTAHCCQCPFVNLN